MKMYIAVLDEVSDFMAPTLVAHSVLGAHIQFTSGKHSEPSNIEGLEQIDGIPDYHDWLNNSFKKCVVRVNHKEFQKISELENVYLGHENTTLGGEKSCAVVCPRHENPNVLKFAKMWKPKNITENS